MLTRHSLLYARPGNRSHRADRHFAAELTALRAASDNGCGLQRLLVPARLQSAQWRFCIDAKAGCRRATNDVAIFGRRRRRHIVWAHIIISCTRFVDDCIMFMRLSDDQWSSCHVATHCRTALTLSYVISSVAKQTNTLLVCCITSS